MPAPRMEYEAVEIVGPRVVEITRANGYEVAQIGQAGPPGPTGPPGAGMLEGTGVPVSSHATSQVYVRRGHGGPAELYYYDPVLDAWSLTVYIP